MSNMHGYHGRLNRLVDDILAANPDEAPTYYRYLAALRSGGFEAWYVDIVGFVSMTTIVQHLRYARGVARWPYGSRYLTILYRENQTRWPAMDWSVGDESA